MEESLKDRFWREVQAKRSPKHVLTVAIRLPTGAIEVITNTDYIPDKIDYYMDKYDEDFKLIANPFVQVIGFMLV